ncbi:MAG TPA: hypothetical protein DHV62_06240, partial [Elusimicrobia bacterium]|nr:hypothetical protein [Elusimicrobiota bacterium]
VKQVWEFINIVADSRNAKYVEESGDYLAKYISDWKGLTPKQWKDSFSMSDRFKFAIATLFQGNRLTKQDTEPFSLLKNYSLDITVYSEFEEGVGLGDNVHSTIISAICALLLKESKRISEIEQIMRNSSFCRLIINLSQAFWWAAGYPDASWLRLVPCFVPWRFQPICIFNRQEEEIRLKGQVFDFFPDDKIGEYYIPNIQIKMEEIIRTFEKFKLRGANDCIGDNVDFAIAYMPRTLLPEARETPPTEAGVGGVLPEDRPIMEALSKITQEIYLELTSKLDWTRVGKLMNAYHFTLSGMRRASRKANELVGALCGVEGVLGAKTSGAGPGGGFVVLYEKKLVNFEKLADIIEKGEHKILTLKLGSRKHLLHPMTSDLSFLSVGVDL